MGYQTIIKNINKFFKKLTTVEKIFIVAIIILIIYAFPWIMKKQEGFETKKEFSVYKGTNIYDNFYVDIYDDLLFDDLRNNYEIGRIMEHTEPTQQSVMVDIGCATGHRVGALTNLGLNITGVDISPNLVNKAKENYPDSKFIQKDITKSIAFEPSSITHISCLYFTIYMIKNKRTFFQNCNNWLMPGGYLILHLVDRDNFDPILPVGNVFTGVDPQNYSKKRITTTAASFGNYDYNAKFDMKDDNAYLIETFKSKKDNSIRKNEHHLYMPTQSSIISMAKDAGFILISKSEMSSCQHNHQYIYILQKPE